MSKKKNRSRIVIACTCRVENYDWVREHGLYNLPLPADGKGESYASVTHIAVYARDLPVIVRAAKYSREVDGKWLAENGYKVSPKPHGERYALFELGGEATETEVYSDSSDVYVCSTRWSGKIDDDFFSRPLPKCDGKSVPNIFERIRPFFGKWRCATAYNPQQMDFFAVLDNVELVLKEFKKPVDGQTIRFIDLFAGIGGIRSGFEQACRNFKYKPQCVFTSEIKPHAIDVLKQNHPNEYIHGDITSVDARTIPDFDILLGGFPCQAFSSAGKRLGFEDTRGTLFFDVARILKEKRPFGFVLENVEGLVNHDKRDDKASYGHTLHVILETLADLGYKVAWRVLNASDFGVPQDRKRIYILGTKTQQPSLDDFKQTRTTVGEILEHGLPVESSRFISKLLSHYTLSELQGKSIKDKRGGENNIHSWDIELKGRVSRTQRELLDCLLRERRKHQWAEQYGIDWMDGMPLTVDMIRTFFDVPRLEEMLEDLADKGYVVKEHPKRKIKVGNVFVREQDRNLPVGYNIVAGKMSFEINKILSPDEIAPTLVAMDMQHLYVVDCDGLRKLSLREGLNLFGYPADFKFDVQRELGYDLLGNTVVVPVIKMVSERLLDVIKTQKEGK